MAHLPRFSSVFTRFIAPLIPFQISAKRQYICHQVPDSDWINAGLDRVIGNHRSGCAFNKLFGSDPGLRKALGKFHLYAGDGHFRAATSHDKRNDKNIRNAIGHLCSPNLRNRFLSHLALGSDGTGKKHAIGMPKKPGHPSPAPRS